MLVGEGGGFVRNAIKRSPPIVFWSTKGLSFDPEWRPRTNEDAMRYLHWLSREPVLEGYSDTLRKVLYIVEQWYPFPGGRPKNQYAEFARLCVGYRVRRWQRLLVERYGLRSGDAGAKRRWPVQLKRWGITGPMAPRAAAVDIVARETDLSADTVRGYATMAKDLPLT